MFEFVHATANTLGQDDDLKRKIRSHAMKDFRARQRQEKRGPASQRSKETRHSVKPGRLAFTFPAQAPTGHSPKEGREPRTQIHEDETSEEAQTNPLALKPSTWGHESRDIFQSPAQLQQMFGLCREWYTWLRPDIKADFAGKPIDQAWSISPCPMLLAANCLAAVGGLDAADSRRPSGLEVLFKGRLLHEVGIRMQSSLAATTDETMSALLFLISYEFYRLNTDAVVHLKGLRSILRVKGQTRVGMRWGGGMVLETLDLLTSLWQNSEPLMTVAEEDHDNTASPETDDSPPVKPPDPHCKARKHFRHIENTLTAEQTSASGEPCLEEHRMKAADGFLELLSTCYLSLPSPEESSEVSHSQESFFERLNTFSWQYCESQPGEETQSHYLARIAHQTMAIFYNVITNRHIFAHATNQGYVNGIVSAVEALEERTWKNFPWLRYLALLTGACASKDPCNKSFFHTHLGRTQMVIGMAKWPVAKNFIMHFSRFKRAIEPKPPKGEIKRGKQLERLRAATGQDWPTDETPVDHIPLDGILAYRTLTWKDEKASTGLEKLLTNDRTFHEAMLSGTFWKTE